MDKAKGPAAEAAPFTPLSQVRAQLGESPVWSIAYQAIWWVDIIGQKLFCTTLDGATREWSTPGLPGFVQIREAEVLVGLPTGIYCFDPVTELFEQRAACTMPGLRFNDACSDGLGRIWAGTMDIDNQNANGTLFLYDPAHQRLEPMADGFRTINGLAWDSARRRLYFSDSHPSSQTVWTSAVLPDGQLSERVVFARFDALDGRPDGAALDADGCYWIAGVGGGTLYRFSPDGALRSCFRVPVQSPTKPAIVGRHGNAMVLTSFDDGHIGGRLALWTTPPIAPLQERSAT